MNRSGERGAVLVWTALILFGLMGMASLAIDLGLARLTQRQMQHATESGALEGLWVRDLVDGVSFTESDRRQQVSDLVSWHFDDNFNTADDVSLLADHGQGELFAGAGPVIPLSGGDGSEMNAYQTIEVDNLGVYKPALEPNEGNQGDGDMLSGQFDPAAAPLEEPDHYEDASYSRSDFTPDDAGSPVNSAFLVRMRRSADAPQPGISSSGPTLPFLFGRGALMAQNPDGTYNPRTDGLTIRATAIADTGRARSIGFPHPETVPPLEGATRFANGATLILLRSFWDAIAPSLTPTDVTVQNDGTITSLGFGLVGAFVNLDASQGVFSLGQDVPGTPVSTADSAPFAAPFTGFVPVVEQIGTTARIIGFGRMDITAWSGTPATVTLTAREAAIAPRNASGYLPGLAGIPPADLAPLWTSHRSFAQALLVPRLVR